MRCILQLRYS